MEENGRNNKKTPQTKFTHSLKNYMCWEEYCVKST